MITPKAPEEIEKMGKVIDVWEDMGWWEDPNEMNPPQGCLVDVVMEDLLVRPARLVVTHEGSEYGYWKLEGGGSYLFDDVHAWSWHKEVEEEYGDNTTA